MSQETYTFACPVCAVRLSVPKALVGVRGPCPQCHHEITAPEPGSVLAPAMAAAGGTGAPPLPAPPPKSAGPVVPSIDPGPLPPPPARVAAPSGISAPLPVPPHAGPPRPGSLPPASVATPAVRPSPASEREPESSGPPPLPPTPPAPVAAMEAAVPGEPLAAVPIPVEAPALERSSVGSAPTGTEDEGVSENEPPAAAGSGRPAPPPRARRSPLGMAVAVLLLIALLAAAALNFLPRQSLRRWLGLILPSQAVEAVVGPESAKPAAPEAGAATAPPVRALPPATAAPAEPPTLQIRPALDPMEEPPPAIPDPTGTAPADPAPTDPSNPAGSASADPPPASAPAEDTPKAPSPDAPAPAPEQPAPTAAGPPEPLAASPAPAAAAVPAPPAPAPEQPAPVAAGPPEPPPASPAPAAAAVPAPPAAGPQDGGVPPSLLPDISQGTPAAPAVVEESVAGAQEALTLFLQARNWKDRMALCESAESLSGEMESHYRKAQDGPNTPTSVDHIASAPLSDGTRTVQVFHVTFPDLPQGFPVPVRQTEEGWKIDWRAFVEFREGRLKKFFAAYQDAPEVFRVRLQRSQQADRAVPNADKKYTFRVAAPIEGHEGSVFVDKDDSIVGPKIANRLDPNEIHLVMVKLKWVRGTNGRTFIELRDIVSESWREAP